MLNKNIALLILLGYIGLITFLSLATIDTKTNIKVDHGDKVIHVLMHIINVILLYVVFVKFKFLRPILLAILVSVIYGIVIEVLQEQLTTERKFDVFDIFANCFGTIVATLILKLKGKAIVKLI